MPQRLSQTIMAAQALLRAGCRRGLAPDGNEIKPGAFLLQDAVNWLVADPQNAGVRAVLVHALHDRAKQFYGHYGFQASLVHPMSLTQRWESAKP